MGRGVRSIESRLFTAEDVCEGIIAQISNVRPVPPTPMNKAVRKVPPILAEQFQGKLPHLEDI